MAAEAEAGEVDAASGILRLAPWTQELDKQAT